MGQNATLENIALKIKPPNTLLVFADDSRVSDREFDIGSDQDLGDLILWLHLEQSRKWPSVEWRKIEEESKEAHVKKFHRARGQKSPLPRNSAEAQPLSIRGTPRGHTLSRNRQGPRNFHPAPARVVSGQPVRNSPLRKVRNAPQHEIASEGQVLCASQNDTHKANIALTESPDNALEMVGK